MKISVGTDIVEINRIKDAIEKDNQEFLSRIYTQKEIEYCESRKKQKYQSYAARFAAKEAVYKALSENITKYNWKDFEILNESNGRPKVNLKIEIENLENIDISLSHCKQYAVAYVTATYKEK